MKREDLLMVSLLGKFLGGFEAFGSLQGGLVESHDITPCWYPVLSPIHKLYLEDIVVSLDTIYNIHATYHFAEYGVSSVEVRLGRMRDKELAAAVSFPERAIPTVPVR